MIEIGLKDGKRLKTRDSVHVGDLLIVQHKEAPRRMQGCTAVVKREKTDLWQGDKIFIEVLSVNGSHSENAYMSYTKLVRSEEICVYDRA